MFKLRDWPFGPGELSTIRWIKSPYSNKKNEWILPVVFEGKKNNKAQVDTLWGSILLLRYGQIYQDGKPFEVTKDGSVLILDIDDASKGGFCKASELIGFLPEGIFNIESEYCWTFENRGYKVFIPCIEIIRSFFTPNKTMANALLTPYGLDDIASFRVYTEQISIDVKSTVPKQVVDWSFAKYLAWLKSNQLAFEVWNSVFRELLPKGAINEMIITPLFDDSGEPLNKDNRMKAKFPIAGPSKLQVRAIVKEERIFVLEVLRVGDLSLPFNKVIFTHSSFKAKRNATGDSRKQIKRSLTRRKKIRNKKELINICPTALSKSVILNSTPTVFVFSRGITISKTSDYVPRYRRKLPNEYRPINDKERKVNRASVYSEELKGDESTPKNLFSTGEIYFDGDSKVLPVEVQGVRAVHGAFTSSFEDFFNMLNILERIESRLMVWEPKIMQLPGLRGIAKKKEEGTPRQCILVPMYLLSTDYKRFYILEIERSPKISLSTLLIWPREEELFTEKTLNILIENLLRNLIRNNGHWKKSDITKNPIAKIVTVKHLDMWEPIDWAYIILSQIEGA